MQRPRRPVLEIVIEAPADSSELVTDRQCTRTSPQLLTKGESDGTLTTRTHRRPGLKAVPRSEMFGDWGNKDHEDSTRIIHRHLLDRGRVVVGQLCSTIISE
jgi:hypothetical protein